MKIKDDYDYSHRLDILMRVTISLFRFIDFVSIIVLLIMSGEYAAAVGRTSELKSGHELYYPYLRPAIMSVPAWCTIAFFFSIFTTVGWGCTNGLPQTPPNLLQERSFLLFIGIGDLLLSVTLSVLIWLQSTFLPRPLGRCISSGIMAIGKEEYNGRSYFDAIARREGRGADGSGLVTGDARGSWCSKFVNIWRFEIAISIMMGGVGLSCLYSAVKRIGVGSRALARYENRLKERMNDITLQTIRPVTATDASTVIKVPQLLNQTSTEKPTNTEYLAKILSQYELLSAVVSELQCSDIANMLYLSRDIRSAILGTTTSPRGLLKKGYCSQHLLQPRLEANNTPLNPFRRSPFYFSRDTHPPPPTPPTPPKPCISCGTITCKFCTRTSPLLDTSTIRHLRDCEPRCTQCYKANHCYSPRARSAEDSEGYMLPESCNWDHTLLHKGRIQDPNNPVDQDQDPIYIDNFASSVQETRLRICEACKRSKEVPLEGASNESNDSKMVNMKGYKLGCGKMRLVLRENENGGEYEAVRVALACGGCGRALEGGEDVWWICKWCKRECVAGWHREMEELVAP